jgi:hypothetical protein
MGFKLRPGDIKGFNEKDGLKIFAGGSFDLKSAV